MSSSLSKLVDNLSEGIHNNKCAEEKGFILMNIQMLGNNLMKYHYQAKKIFIVA